jgi:hypothetical protein
MVVGAMAVIAAGALAVLVVALTLGGGNDGSVLDDGTGKAVIIDQLELTQPNPDFVSQARDILAQGDYDIDYVSGEDVTVDFYRTLPSRKYDIVLLRVHAGITTEVDSETGEKTGTEYVSLFTGELYDETKYPSEQLNRQQARYENGEGDPLFGIGPQFVSKSMEGDFGGATIVMMGCDGLRSQTTAEAFLNRGAGGFVSWTKPVSAPHTDEATILLLQRLILEDLDLQQAVEQTARKLALIPRTMLNYESYRIGLQPFPLFHSIAVISRPDCRRGVPAPGSSPPRLLLYPC